MGRHQRTGFTLASASVLSLGLPARDWDQATL